MNKGLGKGLGALIGEDIVKNTANETGSVMLKLSEIEPNVDQPRKIFSDEALSELAESIRIHGVLTPLIVRQLQSGSYQIIAGERRWRASRMIGLQMLPVIVIEADDRKATELALIENLQREDLNAVEIAEGYRALLRDYGLTQDEVAERVGKSRPAVANAVRLLSLSEKILDMDSSGKISEGHARTLLPLTEKMREKAAERIEKEKMSVRAAENYVKKLLEGNQIEIINTEVDELKEYEENLTKHWGRKISITHKNNKGRISIEFNDADDLEDLIKNLSK